MNNNDWDIIEMSENECRKYMEELEYSASIYEQVRYNLLYDKNGDNIGYICNCYLYNALHLSPDVPRCVHITTNLTQEEINNIPNYNDKKWAFTLYKSPIKVTTENYEYLMAIDALNYGYKRIHYSDGSYPSIDDKYIQNLHATVIDYFFIERELDINKFIEIAKKTWFIEEFKLFYNSLGYGAFIKETKKKIEIHRNYELLLENVPEELHYNIKRLLDKLPSEYRDYRKCSIEHGPLGNTSIAILKYNITENLTGQLFTIELGIPRYGDKIRVDWYIAKHKVREIDIFIFKEMRISRFEKFTLFRFMESNKDYLTYTKDYLDKKRKGLLENE